MAPTTFAVWLFLVIFAVTAAITLLAIVSKVEMEERYRRKLFNVLLVEVIGVVVLLAGKTVEELTRPEQRPDLRRLLLNAPNGWDWQYANLSWRGNLAFSEEKDGKLRVTGQIRDFSTTPAPKVVEFSSAPFDLAAGTDTVEFDMMKDEKCMGRQRMRATLKVGIMISGVARADGEGWSVVLTPGVPGWDNPPHPRPWMAKGAGCLGGTPDLAREPELAGKEAPR